MAVSQGQGRTRTQAARCSGGKLDQRSRKCSVSAEGFHRRRREARSGRKWQMVNKVELRNWIDKISAVKDIIQTVRSEALKGKENEKWQAGLSEADLALTSLRAWLRTLLPKD